MERNKDKNKDKKKMSDIVAETEVHRGALPFSMAIFFFARIGN